MGELLESAAMTSAARSVRDGVAGKSASTWPHSPHTGVPIPLNRSHDAQTTPISISIKPQSFIPAAAHVLLTGFGLLDASRNNAQEPVLARSYQRTVRRR